LLSQKAIGWISGIAASVLVAGLVKWLAWLRELIRLQIGTIAPQFVSAALHKTTLIKKADGFPRYLESVKCIPWLKGSMSAIGFNKN
jgi:hypothetical protein